MASLTARYSRNGCLGYRYWLVRTPFCMFLCYMFFFFLVSLTCHYHNKSMLETYKTVRFACVAVARLTSVNHKLWSEREENRKSRFVFISLQLFVMLIGRLNGLKLKLITVNSTPNVSNRMEKNREQRQREQSQRKRGEIRETKRAREMRVTNSHNLTLSPFQSIIKTANSKKKNGTANHQSIAGR